MIDYQTMVVRPKISSTDEDSVAQALAKHGMTKFAGCPDIYMGATYDRTLGRYLTGLDETHPDILALPQAEMLAKQKEILEERAFLEKQLGVDLHFTNEEFWSTIQIKFDRGMLYNPKIPRHRVIMGVIKAGKIAPTDKSDLGNPDFIGVNFYVGTEYEDVADKSVTRQRERDVAIGLANLLDDFDYAVEVATYLSIQGVSPRIPKLNLDDLISEFIEKKNANKDAFLEAIKEDKEFIRLSNLFRLFKSKGLVSYTEGKWMAGKVKLGKTEKDSVKKLLSADPNMQAELSRLIEDYKDLTGK